MDPPSPPKRMTRSRAAARSNTDGTASSSTASATSLKRAKSSSTASSTLKTVISRTSSSSASTASAKRKLAVPEDSDCENDEDELGLDMPRQPPAVSKTASERPRGRPKKIVAPPVAATAVAESVPAPPPRAPRGRPKKTASAAEQPPSAALPSSNATVRARAARTKKPTATQPDGDAAADEAAVDEAAPHKKKTTRARSASTATASTIASAAAAAVPTITVRTASTALPARMATKKTVTFEEPEKENIAPRPAAKSKSTTKTTANPATKTSKPATVPEISSTGLRAKPLRRPTARSAVAGRSTRTTSSSRTLAAAKATEVAAAAAAAASEASTNATVASGSSSDRVSGKSSAPLSPKKVTQVRLAREMDVESEDELGCMDAKPFLRSPTKPSLSSAAAAARLKMPLESAAATIGNSGSTTVATVALPVEPPAGLLASPARRPPPSPSKEGLVASPVRRPQGLKLLDAAVVPPSTTKALPNKPSLLLSPAKRFPVPPKAHNGGLDDSTMRSPMKVSLLQTPAKRPTSSAKAAILLHRQDAKQPGDDANGMASIDEDASQTADAPKDNTESLTRMIQDMAADAAEALVGSPSRQPLRGRPPATLPHAANPSRLVYESKPPMEKGPDAEAEADEEAKDDPNGHSYADADADAPADADAYTDAEAEADLPEPAYDNILSPGDPMDIDASIVGAATIRVMASPKFQNSPVPVDEPLSAPSALGAFRLRAKDLVYCDADSESEDDLTTQLPMGRGARAPSFGDMPLTPSPATTKAAETPADLQSRGSSASRGTASKRLRKGEFGFTPLAEQLRDWKAHSPSKSENRLSAAQRSNADEAPGAGAKEEIDDTAAPAESEANAVLSFFEDSTANHLLEPSGADLAPVFNNVPVTQEDLELAEEANDMSLMEPEQIEELVCTPSSPDDSASENSQEYGDENAIPIDPALLQQAVPSPDVPPVTPQRVLTRTVHTVTSKVPLKAADESTPRSAMRRRSVSVLSRLPTSVRQSSRVKNNNRAGASIHGADSNSTTTACGVTRSATVISYSPTKRGRRRESFGVFTAGSAGSAENGNEIDSSNDNGPSAPTTPSKSEAAWSTAGTPARTPRRDVDPALLRGAVVFVDVHTTEGADASGIFVELLTQMGARCVKNWSWNPSSPPPNDTSGNVSSKIGITHVVFKDGGKRTLEKVRESGGVVQCVGVSWVLDCERENQWLEEAAYYIDTRVVPRGGARRRKSMEPQALANMNGKIVSTPSRQTYSGTYDRDCFTAPSTPMNRRDSTLWVRTPEKADDDADAYADAEGEPDWDMAGMLTPVPKTPAPEAIARFAAGIVPSTPMAESDDGIDDSTLASIEFQQSQQLIMRTCPPKTSSSHHYSELGAGILSREKDEGVLMRLIAARRKSLQFAPKVASPLSRTWN